MEQSHTFENEIEALKSIYSEPNEICALSKTDILFRASTSSEVHIAPPNGYPFSGSVVNVSVRSELLTKRETADVIERISKELKPLAQERQPYLMDVCVICRQSIAEAEAASSSSEHCLDNGKPSRKGTERLRLTAISLEHMHDPVGYAAKLRSFSADCSVTARLLLVGRPPPSIRLVVWGRSDAVGRFVKRLRTATVDVDVSGRPCRERKSTVLYDAPIDGGTALVLGKDVVCFDQLTFQTEDECFEAVHDQLGLSLDVCQMF